MHTGQLGPPRWQFKMPSRKRMRGKAPWHGVRPESDDREVASDVLDTQVVGLTHSLLFEKLTSQYKIPEDVALTICESLHTTLVSPRIARELIC